MDPITQQTTLAAAGGKKDPVYVDDVFSTFVYPGDGQNPRNINNGIDLAGEGGLVWVKARTLAEDHIWVDTERGAGNYIWSNSTNAQVTNGGTVIGFNNNGFQINNNGYVNGGSGTYASWSFRKAPGFFDVVTYTGSGSGTKTISHNLGSVPGMIIVKGTNAGSDWSVYHRNLNGGSSPEDWYLSLNHPYTESNAVANWGGTAPTATEFTVGGNTNASINYVAYIFAHDEPVFGTDGDESIIKCGSFTGGGSLSSPKYTDIGFEPQFVFFKRTDSTSLGYWYMFDSMRGAANSGTNQPILYANDPGQESNGAAFWVHQNGFATSEDLSNGNFIYMAIRRPHKPPTAATEVFAIDTRSGTSPTPPTYKSGFPVDWVWERRSDQTNNWSARTRLIGEGKEFDLNTTGAESSNTTDRITFDRNDGVGTENSVVSTQYAWMFKRTPGFFDVVAYTGTGSPHTINHNLTVPPELMIVKSRSYADAWHVYSSALGNTKYMSLNTTTKGNTLAVWNNTTPTSSVFSVGSRGETNTSSATYINYLFATLPGISKVGSYSGSSSAQNIDCGFTNGARFVLIKRTDSSGHWMVFDTSRGIISGSDPGLRLDLPNPQSDTTFDYIDPYSAGFTIRSFGDVNTSGGTYIFLAIA